MKVWVVVHRVPESHSAVLGVYGTEQLAELAASHPYDSLEVIEFDVVMPEGVST